MALPPDVLDHLRRNSRLRLDCDGHFWLAEERVAHPRVERLFHQGLSLEADTGRLVLRVGPQWAYVQFVDDVPWFVTRLRRTNDALHATLADGSEVDLDPSTLEMTPAGHVHAELSGRGRARLLRDATSALTRWLDFDGERPVLMFVSGRRVPIQVRAE